MQLRENLSKSDIISTIIFSILMLAIGCAIGLYGGGYVFLLISKVDTNLLSYDTLINAWPLWEYKKLHAAISLGTIVFAVALLVPFAAVIISAFFEFPEPDYHGNAKLITDEEIKESGLLDIDDEYPDILIGKVAKGRYKGQYLKFAGQQFLGLGAPTRSGKGVGFVIPNLLNYRDSVCVLDIKAENYIFTAGYRKEMGQEVYVFAPDGYRFSKEEFEEFKLSDYYIGLSADEQKAFNEKFLNTEHVLTHRWNPLDYISRSKAKRIGEIKDLSKILFPDEGGDNAIWNSMAEGIFQSYIIYMLDMEDNIKKINSEIEENRKNGVNDDRELMKPYPVSIAQMMALTGVPDIAEWMNDELLYWKDKGYPLSRECEEGFNKFISVDPKTRGNMMQNFQKPLNIFEAESCRLATAASDFRFEDLRRKRMSVYLVLSATGMDKYKTLINLFFSQLVSVNTKTLPEHDSSLKYQCLLILDEFPAMGRVGIIENSIAFTAGYNIRYMLIYQNDEQLESDSAYGKAGAFTLKKNLAVEIVYPPKTVDTTAERVSKTFGKKTVKVKTSSRSNNGGKISNSTNEQYIGRDLYMPQEIVNLGAKKHVMQKINKGKKTKVAINEVVIMEQVKPFVAHKIVYFDEPVFMQRRKVATDNIPEVPILGEFEVYELPREKRRDIPNVARS
ncbi:type IV secretory system conjugative DNA transfer family protein [Shigella flexneri]|nr:type IV secretory system conjugative DNA transfer family protein [Salmonella enterica subsp. enterica serovar Enteritidis]EBZ8819621.1 type IV secretory system conjugative DNA transfer family protein [Salmonella enterica subsp. enterica serovar Stanley]ECA6566269.1 type IV secretory system conjugative DNA transfer family protein [Salmonella enterica subsp. enterica serovar Agona]MEP52602.1 type IV secretory system conjugative DNA transfer family protein [Salmonella enterica]HCO1080805.1 type